VTYQPPFSRRTRNGIYRIGDRLVADFLIVRPWDRERATTAGSSPPMASTGRARYERTYPTAAFHHPRRHDRVGPEEHTVRAAPDAALGRGLELPLSLTCRWRTH
jgi:hypothetical protein